MTGGHVPTKGKGKPTSPPNVGSGGRKADSPVSQKGESQSCETCRFCAKGPKRHCLKDDPEPFEYYCRRRAPVFGQGDGITRFPSTDLWGWCGEYQPSNEQYAVINQWSAVARCNAWGHLWGDDGQCARCGVLRTTATDPLAGYPDNPPRRRPEPILENRSCVDGLPDVCKSGVHEYLEGGGATSCIFCGHVPDD